MKDTGYKIQDTGRMIDCYGEPMLSGLAYLCLVSSVSGYAEDDQ